MLQCWAVLFMLSTSSARRPTACSTTCQTTGCMNLPRWATNAVAPTTHSSCGELLRLILLCDFFSRPLAHGYTAVRGTGLAAAIWPCDACAALLTAVVCCPQIWNCSQDQSNHIVHEFFKSDHFNDGIPIIPGVHHGRHVAAASMQQPEAAQHLCRGSSSDSTSAVHSCRASSSRNIHCQQIHGLSYWAPVVYAVSVQLPEC
jgi:hypothetical protein